MKKFFKFTTLFFGLIAAPITFFSLSSCEEKEEVITTEISSFTLKKNSVIRRTSIDGKKFLVGYDVVRNEGANDKLTYAITSGELPSSLSFDETTGVISQKDVELDQNFTVNLTIRVEAADTFKELSFAIKYFIAATEFSYSVDPKSVLTRSEETSDKINVSLRKDSILPENAAPDMVFEFVPASYQGLEFNTSTGAIVEKPNMSFKQIKNLVGTTAIRITPKSDDYIQAFPINVYISVGGINIGTKPSAPYGDSSKAIPEEIINSKTEFEDKKLMYVGSNLDILQFHDSYAWNTDSSLINSIDFRIIKDRDPLNLRTSFIPAVLNEDIESVLTIKLKPSAADFATFSASNDEKVKERLKFKYTRYYFKLAGTNIDFTFASFNDFKTKMWNEKGCITNESEYTEYIKNNISAPSNYFDLLEEIAKLQMHKA